MKNLLNIYKLTSIGSVKKRMYELKPGDVFRMDESGVFIARSYARCKNGVWGIKVEKLN